MTAWRRRLLLAGRRLQVEGKDRTALDAIAPALGHLECDDDSGQPGVRWTVTDAGEPDRPSQAQGIYRLPGGGIAVVQHDPLSIESYDPAIGLRLAATPAALASGDLRAHPGGYALAAWLAGPSTHVLHAAAVSFDGRAVVLVGPGGTGKSTTALACARAGADFLGDDLCLAEAGDEDSEPQVHCLFASAKLNPDSAERLGARDWPVLGTTPKGKIVVTLPAPMAVGRSAPIVAVVILHPHGDARGGIERLRPAPAVAAVTATGATPCSGALNPVLWFSTMTRLLKKVPAYRVPIDWDLVRLVDRIRGIAAGGAMQ